MVLHTRCLDGVSEVDVYEWRFTILSYIIRSKREEEGETEKMRWEGEITRRK